MPVCKSSYRQKIAFKITIKEHKFEMQGVIIGHLICYNIIKEHPNQIEKDIARLKLQGVMNMIFICIIAFPLVVLAELMKINK